MCRVDSLLGDHVGAAERSAVFALLGVAPEWPRNSVRRAKDSYSYTVTSPYGMKSWLSTTARVMMAV